MIFLPKVPAGERPLSGGDVDSSLFSNIARRLRTPPLTERWAAMMFWRWRNEDQIVGIECFEGFFQSGAIFIVGEGEAMRVVNMA
jgi:hypothetical protein